MKRRGALSGSEDSLTLRRSKRGQGRVTRNAQEDPGTGGGGQSARVPSSGGGDRHSGDQPQAGEYLPADPASMVRESHAPSSDLPAQAGESAPELSHYKGVSLTNVGRDRYGKVIPHKRSEPLAKQIAIWVAGGFNVNDIAIRINVRPGLIKACYGKELATGETNVHMDVHGHILKRVKQSDRMAIFYAKSRMGWRDGEGAQKDTAVLDIHLHL